MVKRKCLSNTEACLYWTPHNGHWSTLWSSNVIVTPRAIVEMNDKKAKLWSNKLEKVFQATR